MPDPVIGVTTYQGRNEKGYPIHALLRAYVNALLQVGCIPVLIPSGLSGQAIDSLQERLDGVLFTGGGDIALDRFDGEPHPRIDGVDVERDALEFSMLRTVIEKKKPFLGICRGFQVIVVGMGGTLYTNIEGQLPGAHKHDYYPGIPRNYLAHEVKIKSGTRLARILDQEVLMVNSLHHQGANAIPENLTISAFAPDGLVEAVELPGHPFGMAVQWHPEWLMDQPAAQDLFRAFIDASRE
jgi:putative glutamine amidotransferase